MTGEPVGPVRDKGDMESVNVDLVLAENIQNSMSGCGRMGLIKRDC